MQPVDYTTLMALAAELRTDWLPARLEQVYQRDRFTVALALRTLQGRGWLNLCWHPQAAHLCISDPPPRAPDTFTFSQQLKHQLGGLTLAELVAIAPWERVLDLRFSKRPGDPVLWHLYVEIMGKYSNVILVNQQNIVVTAAHQVSDQQSSLRAIQTGDPYEVPPKLTDSVPSLSESFEQWRSQVALVPGPLRRTLIKVYRGLSSRLVNAMIQSADLDPNQSTDDLSEADWQRLFLSWQQWLTQLATEKFQPGWLSDGSYTVVGWGSVQPADSVQSLVQSYYRDHRDRQRFAQLHHQLSQKLNSVIQKQRTKLQDFQKRLDKSDQSEAYRERADLLMAYLHEWSPGMTQITLNDFATGEPQTLALDPEKNAVQNAQALYKRHQKLRRSQTALQPLIADVQEKLAYLEQVEVAIAQLETYQTSDDLAALEEIRDELVSQTILEAPTHRSADGKRSGADHTSEFLHYQSPSGFEVLVGRNNRQNDRLTFRLANDYDLWFHTQEIPGSHVLLRLDPGSVPDLADLQFTANLAAYHSRARQSDQVPVIYTDPKHVYKPKGAAPGVAIYKQETVIWGNPTSFRHSSSEPVAAS